MWCKKWSNWTSGVGIGQKNLTSPPSVVRNPTPTPPWCISLGYDFYGKKAELSSTVLRKRKHKTSQYCFTYLNARARRWACTPCTPRKIPPWTAASFNIALWWSTACVNRGPNSLTAWTGSGTVWPGSRILINTWEGVALSGKRRNFVEYIVYCRFWNINAVDVSGN